MAFIAFQPDTPLATFTLTANTEGALPAGLVLARLQAGIDLIALSVAASQPRSFFEADEYRVPARVWSFRSRLRILRLSYENPINEVVAAEVAKHAAEKAAGLIETLGTIGLERAERRERVEQARIDTAVREATMDLDVDDRFERSVRLQLENESLRLDNFKKRLDLAMDIIEAQKRLRAEDGVTDVWPLGVALEVLDPSNAGTDVVNGIRDLQSVGTEVSAQAVELDEG